MKIKINDKEIELKYTMRSMMMFENVTNKSFNPTTISDIVTFMYCVAVSSVKDYSISFEDFLDYVDSTPGCIGEFSKWMNDIVVNQNKLKKG